MTGGAEVKLEEKNVKKLENSMVLKGIQCNGYSKPSVSEVFPFFNTCAPGSRPCSGSHFTRTQMATGIHLFGPINTKTWFPTWQKSEIYLINVTRKRFLIITEEVTTDEAGRSTYPGLFLSFVISVHARGNLIALWEPVRSDERSVTPQPGTWSLASSAHTSTWAQAVGGGAGMQKSNQGKQRPQTPHSKLPFPTKMLFSE